MKYCNYCISLAILPYLLKNVSSWRITKEALKGLSGWKELCEVVPMEALQRLKLCGFFTPPTSFGREFQGLCLFIFCWGHAGGFCGSNFQRSHNVVPRVMQNPLSCFLATLQERVCCWHSKCFALEICCLSCTEIIWRFGSFVLLEIAWWQWPSGHGRTAGGEVKT